MEAGQDMEPAYYIAEALIYNHRGFLALQLTVGSLFLAARVPQPIGSHSSQQLKHSPQCYPLVVIRTNKSVIRYGITYMDPYQVPSLLFYPASTLGE